MSSSTPTPPQLLTRKDAVQWHCGKGGSAIPFLKLCVWFELKYRIMELENWKGLQPPAMQESMLNHMISTILRINRNIQKLSELCRPSHSFLESLLLLGGILACSPKQLASGVRPYASIPEGRVLLLTRGQGSRKKVVRLACCKVTDRSTELALPVHLHCADLLTASALNHDAPTQKLA